MQRRNAAVLYALLAAVCYGVSAPASKLLLQKISPPLMAALLYLGAGLGMGAVSMLQKGRGKASEARIGGKDLPYIAGMILLDIAAPICLMLSLQLASPASVSLLNNFEIVATALIAWLLFKEAIGRRLWAAIALISAASVLLSVDDLRAFSFSPGALLALLACLFWGLENNCTRMLSLKNPLEIVILKGFGSGTGALLVAFLTRNLRFDALYAGFAMLLGLFAYGLSIWFYIRAQRELGAARTSAYYAFAPFVGVLVSWLIFGQQLSLSFAAALVLMLLGAWAAASERHSHLHVHERLSHEHSHNHQDGHHSHAHNPPFTGTHSHPHVHEKMAHAHPHTPDLHHTHAHGA